MTEQHPTEYVVWGTAPGERFAEPLFTTDPRTGKYITERWVAERLETIAKDRGATGVYIQEVDLSVPPSFT